MLALLNFTHFVAKSGYAAVFILSVLQSCCVPTSSEITLGYAGVLASQHTLSLPGVIAAGVGGEVVGAVIAYVIGRSAGRAVVDKWGRYILMTHRDLDRAEAWYGRHERWGVFGSRLLPVIRNFVAVPAGVAEVPIVRFVVLTFFGSLVWDSAMAVIGYEVGGQYTKVMHGFTYAGYLLGVLAVAAIAFVIWHRWRSFKQHAGEPAAAGRAGVSGAGAGGPAPRRVAGPSRVGGATGRVEETTGSAGAPGRTAGRVDGGVAGRPRGAHYRKSGADERDR